MCQGKESFALACRCPHRTALGLLSFFCFFEEPSVFNWHASYFWQKSFLVPAFFQSVPCVQRHTAAWCLLLSLTLVRSEQLGFWVSQGRQPPPGCPLWALLGTWPPPLTFISHHRHWLLTFLKLNCFSLLFSAFLGAGTVLVFCGFGAQKALPTLSCQWGFRKQSCRCLCSEDRLRGERGFCDLFGSPCLLRANIRD